MKIPKPPKRVRDKALLARFRETRPWCQICGVSDGGNPGVLHVHHLTDNPDIHRRSDVQDNLMRLCWICHAEVHQITRWNKEQLRALRSDDLLKHNELYADMEDQYDREVRGE